MNLFQDLERPSEPALPKSFFWTWDHSTNWVLDDPGLQATGCNNRYLKQPETFLVDYRRLSDAAAKLGVRGLIIWGFLRDRHGGIEYARRVADDAAAKGVAILPGVGTTAYGGVFYEGEHPYCLEHFLAEHPDARMLSESGQPAGGACAAHPAFAEWMAEGLQWLTNEFHIGGFNLENGDLLVDHHPLMKARRAAWPASDPEFFFNQAVSYQIALDAVADRLDELMVTYASYMGFVPGNPEGRFLPGGPWMYCERPAMLDHLPRNAWCQWTISGMMRERSLPLTDYLDEGAPAAAFENQFWPSGLCPPRGRSVGFVHQPSQWGSAPDRKLGRYQQAVSLIKEACLRAHRAGLEGVGIHGEVTAQYVPWALNYLAFSHFIHWPADTLRDFARKTLAPVLGDSARAEEYVEAFARYDAGAFTDDDLALAAARAKELRSRAAQGDGAALYPHRFWHWLHQVGAGQHETQTVSFF